ncbi:MULTISPECIES: hypothetical protein [unclassified Amycolatopsis]|uniref:hypothetical protein n=1 Tax=unclassified Amycolatopsis TaxID=2618356 RepID=UPI00287413C9|nr:MULTISPECIES: hypothetical protein [unclassified Amycolatopsis]MDS0135218.1 hypothetical protein [Amycolatopsis sp. 505]MDS0143005.1 hypothetical protein [Amycolatopsis sp. CM201R]
MAKLRGLVLVGLLGAVLFTASPAYAAPVRPVAVTVSVSSAALVPAQTQPPGPVLDPAQTDKANSEKTRNKLVAGLIAVVLLGIVIWGRKIRSKRAKGS